MNPVVLAINIISLICVVLSGWNFEVRLMADTCDLPHSVICIIPLDLFIYLIMKAGVLIIHRCMGLVFPILNDPKTSTLVAFIFSCSVFIDCLFIPPFSLHSQ
jgi:hypothetical protein